MDENVFRTTSSYRRRFLLTLHFDESGKRIPKITPEDAHRKIQQNLSEYNSEIRAKNFVHKIAEALAVVTIENPEALDEIRSKISPQLQKEINEKIPSIRAGIKGGWLKINHQKMSRSVEQMKKYFEESS